MMGLIGFYDDDDPKTELVKQMVEQLAEALNQASEEFKKAREANLDGIEGASYGRIRVQKGQALGWFEWIVPDVEHDVFEFRYGQQHFRVVAGSGKLQVAAFDASSRTRVRTVQVSKLKGAAASGVKLLPLLAKGYSLLDAIQTAKSYSEADTQIEILQAYRDVIRSNGTADAALKIGRLTDLLYKSPFSVYGGMFASLGSGVAEEIGRNDPKSQGAKNKVVEAIDKVIAEIKASQ
jgi:hypothetical protein